MSGCDPRPRCLDHPPPQHPHLGEGDRRMMPRTPPKPPEVDHQQRQADAIERRVYELQVTIPDKRDAANYHRRTAKEIDADADLLLDELNALNIMRAGATS